MAHVFMQLHRFKAYYPSFVSYLPFMAIFVENFSGRSKQVLLLIWNLHFSTLL